jgi:hypothetical protein
MLPKKHLLGAQKRKKENMKKDILDDINLDSILEDFASKNAKRRFFTRH